jgi:hypothetical protein
MYKRPENMLQQIRIGMKIGEGNKLKAIDDLTFNTLIAYGNTLYYSPRAGHKPEPGYFD